MGIKANVEEIEEVVRIHEEVVGVQEKVLRGSKVTGN